MDTRSLATLLPLCPGFIAKVRAADTELLTRNIRICVYSGLRTAAEQDALYASSRPPNKGPWKTNARAGQSMHNYGLAADIVPYVGATMALNWDTNSPTYSAMVEALKAQGLDWGGDWVHSKDMDHFQMSGYPTTPSLKMQEKHGTEPLAYFWPESGVVKYF